MGLHSIERFKTGGELPPLVVLVNAIIAQAASDYRRSLRVNEEENYEADKLHDRSEEAVCNLPQ